MPDYRSGLVFLVILFYKAGQTVAHQREERIRCSIMLLMPAGTSTSFNSLSCRFVLREVQEMMDLPQPTVCRGRQANLDLWRTDHYVPRDSVNLVVYPKYDASKLLLTTEPQDKAVYGRVTMQSCISLHHMSLAYICGSR